MDLVKHLLMRRYDPSRYKHQTLDTYNNILTTHLMNLSGQFVGFQQYNPQGEKKVDNAAEGRYFTITPRGTLACWGIEVLDPKKKDLYIVEGVFKASALHMTGRNALAVLSNNPKHLKSWLHTMNYRLIGIGDGDKAGRHMQRVAGEGFQSEKDLDEYSTEELDELLRDKGYV